MISRKNTPLQLLLLSSILLLAPLIGALIGYLSPIETHNQARALMNRVFNTGKKAASDFSNGDEYVVITSKSGELVCADGRQHEIPCWRLRLERTLLTDTQDAYIPIGQDQLYGIIKERTGPNGNITTLTKKHDLLEQNTTDSPNTGSRFASAQKALSR